MVECGWRDSLAPYVSGTLFDVVESHYKTSVREQAVAADTTIEVKRRQASLNIYHSVSEICEFICEALVQRLGASAVWSLGRFGNGSFGRYSVVAWMASQRYCSCNIVRNQSTRDRPAGSHGYLFRSPVSLAYWAS